MFSVHSLLLLTIKKCSYFGFIVLLLTCLFMGTEYPANPAHLLARLLPAQAHADNQDDDHLEENDEEENEETTSRVVIIHGTTQIRLTTEEQLHSGIISKILTETRYLPEQPVFGQVMTIQGLIELRNRYQTALSEQAMTTSTLTTAQHNYQRLKQLHQEAIIPMHKLQWARSVWQSGQIKLEAHETDLQSIRATAEQTWGFALTQSVLDDPALLFRPLLKRQQLLIRVSLKTGQSLLEDTSFIFIARDNDRQKAHKAYLISAAPQIGTVSQGESYFFRSNPARLRIGMPIYAWIPQAGQSLTGVTIPESAIVWYAGKPWVYLQTNAEYFTRQALPQHYMQGNARFVSDALFLHKPVVITGGQMLLSEEFRWQIPEEDDD